jgi:asparaginyl-tRNA synthetase
MIKYCINYCLEHAKEEMEFFNRIIDKHCIERVTKVANSEFKRMTYTEAIEELMKVKDRFENKNIYWGMDLQSEHERYICEKVILSAQYHRVAFSTNFKENIQYKS